MLAKRLQISVPEINDLPEVNFGPMNPWKAMRNYTRKPSYGPFQTSLDFPERTPSNFEVTVIRGRNREYFDDEIIYDGRVFCP